MAQAYLTIVVLVINKSFFLIVHYFCAPISKSLLWFWLHLVPLKVNWWLILQESKCNKKLLQRQYMAERNLKFSIQEVVFHFIEGRLPSKIIFPWRSSSLGGHLPSKIDFQGKSSSIKGHLPLKVVFHQRLSSIKGCLTSKDVFHQRLSSSIKGQLPL